MKEDPGFFFWGVGILVFLDKDFKTAFINIFMDSKEKMYIKKKQMGNLSTYIKLFFKNQLEVLELKKKRKNVTEILSIN